MRKRPIPLTALVLAALAKHGPATTDAIAKRTGYPSPAVSKALSKNKLRGRVTFTVRAGEAVWRKRAARKR